MTSNVTCPPVSTATLSVAVEQFIEAKQAQRLSKNTLIEYNRTLRYFREFFGNEDPLMSAITQVAIRKFMNSLDHLSKKSLLNVHIGLSSLWHWASDEGLCTDNIMHKVARPRPEIRAVQPFRMKKSIGYSMEFVFLLNIVDLGKGAAQVGCHTTTERGPSCSYCSIMAFEKTNFATSAPKISMVQLSKFSEKEPRNASSQSPIVPSWQSRNISNKNVQAILHKMRNLFL